MEISEHSGMDTSSQIARCTDEILLCLVSCADPIGGIVRQYDKAKDKDVFVTALAASLLLRHRQWQASERARTD